MAKKEVQQRVLQNGKPLDLDKFVWDEENRVFSSIENNLVLDFKGVDDCTFDTGGGCTFKTGHDCTFDTGSGCTFKTNSNCTFDTGGGCTFDTGSGCVVVRRDVYEVIEIPENTKIKLNGYGIKGYTIIKDIDKEKIQEKIKKYEAKIEKLLSKLVVLED